MYQDPNPYANRRRQVIEKLREDGRADRERAAQASRAASHPPAPHAGQADPSAAPPSGSAPAPVPSPTPPSPAPARPADRVLADIERVRSEAHDLRERMDARRAAANVQMAERARLLMGSSAAPPQVPEYLMDPQGIERIQAALAGPPGPRPEVAVSDTGPWVHRSERDPLGVAREQQQRRASQASPEDVMAPVVRAAREAIVEEAESRGPIGRAVTGLRMGVREAPGGIGMLMRLGLPEDEALKVLKEADADLGVTGTVSRWAGLLTPPMMEILTTKRLAAAAAPHVGGRTGQLLNVIGRSEGKTIAQSMATGALEGIVVDVIDAIEHGDASRAGIGIGLGALTGPFVDAIGRHVAKRSTAADQELIAAVARSDLEQAEKLAKAVEGTPRATAKSGLTPEQERALETLRARGPEGRAAEAEMIRAERAKRADELLEEAAARAPAPPENPIEAAAARGRAALEEGDVIGRAAREAERAEGPLIEAAGLRFRPKPEPERPTSQQAMALEALEARSPEARALEAERVRQIRQKLEGLRRPADVSDRLARAAEAAAAVEDPIVAAAVRGRAAVEADPIAEAARRATEAEKPVIEVASDYRFRPRPEPERPTVEQRSVLEALEARSPEALSAEADALRAQRARRADELLERAAARAPSPPEDPIVAAAARATAAEDPIVLAARRAAEAEGPAIEVVSGYRPKSVPDAAAAPPAVPRATEVAPDSPPPPKVDDGLSEAERARRLAARDIAEERARSRAKKQESQSEPLAAQGIEGYSVRKGPAGWEVVRPNGQAGRRGFRTEQEALAAIPDVAKLDGVPLSEAGFATREVVQTLAAGSLGAAAGSMAAPEGQEGLGAVLVGTAAAVLGTSAGRAAAGRMASGLRVRGDFLPEQHVAKVTRGSNISAQLAKADFIVRDMRRAIEEHVGATAIQKAAHRQGLIDLLDEDTARALTDVLQHRPAREAVQNWARDVVDRIGLTGRRLEIVRKEVDEILEGDPLPSRIYRYFDDLVYGDRQWLDDSVLPVLLEQMDDLARNTPLPLHRLPEPLRKPALEMRLQVEALAAEGKRIGLFQDSPTSVFDLNEGLYLNRSYRAIEAPEEWQKFIEKDPRGQALWNRAVEDVRARKPDWTDAEVENFLMDILQRPDIRPDVLSGAKLGAKNLSIVMKRGDITPAIRALMGENTDPLVQYYASVMKMTNMVENHRFLQNLRDAGLGINIFTKDARPSPKTLRTVEIASSGSDVYSPMNGLYVTPELKEALERAVEGANIDSAIMLFLARGNAMSKFAKTVLSPMTQVRNITGSHFTLTAQGSLFEPAFWRNYTRGFEVAHGAKVMGVGDKGILRGGYGDGMSKQDYIIDLTRRGVIDESVGAGTLEDLRAEAFRKVRSPTSPDAVRVLSRAAKVGGTQLDNAVAMYRAGDDFAKIVQFETEFDRYLKVFNGDREAAAARAAQIVRDVLPTYSQVPWAINQLRRFPVFGTFVSFPYEVIRNTANTVRLAKAEIADEATREIGIKRLAGLMSSVTAGSMASVAAAKAVGVTFDDDRDIREFLPFWSENSVLVYKDFDPSAGKVSFIDISYTDPFSYLNKPIVALLAGGDGERTLFEAGMEMSRAFVGQEIFFGALLQSIEDMERAHGATDKLAVLLGNIADALEPGFVTQATRVMTGYNNMSVGSHLRGRKPTRELDRTVEAMAILSGLRVTELDVATALRFRAQEYDAEIRAARRRYDALARSVKEYPESKLVKEAHRYLDSEEQIDARYRRMAFAAARLGVPPEEVRRQMRAGGMSNATIDRILGGG